MFQKPFLEEIDMRNKLLTAGLAATLGLAMGAVQAAPVSLPPGPIFIKFQNLEQISTDPTKNSIDVSTLPDGANAPSGLPTQEQSWGIIQVSQVFNGIVVDPHNLIGGGTTTVYDVNSSPDTITGIFYGLTSTGCGSSGGTLCGTGGYLDLYYNTGGTKVSINDGTHLPADRTSKTTYPGFTDGTFLARLDFATGIDGGSVNLIGFGSPTIGGAAAGYLNVDLNPSAKGAWTNSLDGNYFWPAFGTGIPDPTAPRDVRFNDGYNPLASWNGNGHNWDNSSNPECVTGQTCVGAISNDPVMAYTTPEPASLALMGIGLMGLAFRARRKAA